MNVSKKAAIIFACCLSFIVGIGLYLNINTGFISPGAHSFNQWMKSSDADRIKKLKTESKKEFADVNEADKSVSYKVKFVKNTGGRKLLGVFLSGSQETITLLYQDGLYVNEMYTDTPPDYNRLVEQEKLGKEKGTLNADSVSVLLKVNGYDGYGSEPGYNDFGTIKEPRPGFVEWYENGVKYTVFGDNIPLNDLITIAETMENVSNKIPQPKTEKPDPITPNDNVITDETVGKNISEAV